MPTKTKSQLAAADVAVLIRARNPLLWIVTREEARVEQHLFQATLSLKAKSRTWDIAQGIVMEIGGKPVDPATADPDEMLDRIRTAATLPVDVPENQSKLARGVWVLRDLPAWLSGIGGARTLRRLRNLVRLLPGVPIEAQQTLIVLSPSSEIPPELAGHTIVIEWPMPDREEIAGFLDETLESNPSLKLSKELREAAIDAAVGLNGEEAQACYAKSIVQLKRIDPVTVAKEKRRVVAREGVIEWFDPLPGGLSSIGGLDDLKGWLLQRKLAYSAEARAYGLPAPKGTLLVGVPGCGKSLTAKAVATAWEVPLLRVDLGGLKSKFVGESEGNLRKAFAVIAAIGRCVVWFDEIEKALQGATSGSADGGVSSDALGTILSWMQERSGEAFVIATANDVSALPPELLRKGRFDELWFVDLPNSVERIDILKAALKTHGRINAKIEIEKVAAACDKFTGSEIAALVPEALFEAFADNGREPKTSDLLKVAKSVHPLSQTASEKIKRLRDWQETNGARPATSKLKEIEATTVRRRVLDVEA